MMDAVDPHLVERVEELARAVAGVEDVLTLRLRWVGHRMYGVIKVAVPADASLADSEDIVSAVQREASHVIPQLTELTVEVVRADV